MWARSQKSLRQAIKKVFSFRNQQPGAPEPALSEVEGSRFRDLGFHRQSSPRTTPFHTWLVSFIDTVRSRHTGTIHGRFPHADAPFLQRSAAFILIFGATLRLLCSRPPIRKAQPIRTSTSRACSPRRCTDSLKCSCATVPSIPTPELNQNYIAAPAAPLCVDESLSSISPWPILPRAFRLQPRREILTLTPVTRIVSSDYGVNDTAPLYT